MLAHSPGQLAQLPGDDIMNTMNMQLDPSDTSVENRKLVILGLPWETTEETFRQYFEQFGNVEEATIMKDRATGKSRGFGFIVYYDPADAARAVETEHVVDGRRCEAKYAEPRGSGTRCSRIFVARIHPSVTDAEFRDYFGQFGTVQDAYMPREASKLSHRGIGFVTFASPDAVEKLMTQRHTLKGQELAVDRATPKDKGAANTARGQNLQDKLLAGQFSNPNNQLLAHYSQILASLIAGGQGVDHHYGDGHALAANPALASQLAAAAGGGGGAGYDPSYHQQMGNGPMAGAEMEGGQAHMEGMQGSADFPNEGNGGMQGMPYGHGMLGDARAMRSMHSNGSMNGTQLQHEAALHSSIMRIAQQRNSAPLEQMHHGMIPGALAAGMHMSSSAPGRSVGIMGADQAPRGGVHNGPRIFVGKLNKTTTGQDVKDYFTRFGYVLDVYMPKDKMNRNEHRGFGFVTFETEGAVARVATHGTHQIKGTIVAIDSAVPRAGGGPFPRSGSGASGMDPNHPGAEGMGIGDNVGPARNNAQATRPGYRPY